jgi:putative lipase involved disintegration of autophagic bodies
MLLRPSVFRVPVMYTSMLLLLDNCVYIIFCYVFMYFCTCLFLVFLRACDCSLQKVKVKVKVTLRLTVSQSVRLGVEPTLRLLTR